MITRAQRKRLQTENRKHAATLSPVHESEWPQVGNGQRPNRVLRSRHYLVQEFLESNGIIRLSANRTKMLPDGHWDDGLTWDELNTIKQQCGYAERYAIEIYPDDSNIVNVANLRHLWILPDPLDIGWRAKP